MLNRRHARIKVMQSLYAYYSEELPDNKSVLMCKNHLDTNINNFYQLYLTLLLFVVELSKYAQKYDQSSQKKYVIIENEFVKNFKFYENEIINNLKLNETFSNLKKTYKIHLTDEELSIVRKMFNNLKNTEIYLNFISPINDYDEFELFSYIIKYYTTDFGDFVQLLENKFINWHDDDELVRKMVIKTFRKIMEKKSDIILPMYSEKSETLEFAKKLLETVILKDRELQEKIFENLDFKWNESQVAKIDSILIKMGIAEFLYFPSINKKITLNEYIEIAKYYGSNSSRNFVNGILHSAGDL